MSFSTMLPPTLTPAIVYSPAPGSFYDSIIVGGRVLDMSGATVLFFLRPLMSRAPVLNGNAAHPVVPTDGNGKNVRYDFSSGDITATGHGDFMAWWRFTLPAETPQDTPEFPIIITDHGPGLGTDTGMIVDGVTAFMPVTLDHLRTDSRFGDRWLQQQAEVVKYRVLGYTMSADQEESLHPVLLDFLSKRLALALTKPGIEYWSRQQRTSTSTQTSEVTSFPDMAQALEKLASRLVIELTQQWRELLLIVPGLPQRKVMPLPVTSLGDPYDPANPTADFVTPNPTAVQRPRLGVLAGGAFGSWPFP